MNKSEPTTPQNRPYCVGYTGKGGKSRSVRVYSLMGKAITLAAEAGGGGAQTGLYLWNDAHVYSLNDKGAALLQGLPEDYADMLTKTAACKAYGNGWTVDVIAHILNHINIDKLL